MLTQHRVGPDAHGGQVEGTGDVPGRVAQERVGPTCAQDVVAVAPGQGAVPGVEAIGGDAGLDDDDGAGELMAERQTQALEQHPWTRLAPGKLGEDLGVDVGVHDLAEGVHAGIGPAGTGEAHLVAQHRGQLVLKGSPDGRLAGLGGKAVQGRPVVGDKQHYATKRPTWGRFSPGLEEPHTSSTRAMGRCRPGVGRA